jgi:hypothetical protein
MVGVLSVLWVSEADALSLEKKVRGAKPLDL